MTAGRGSSGSIDDAQGRATLEGADFSVLLFDLLTHARASSAADCIANPSQFLLIADTPAHGRHDVTDIRRRALGLLELTRGIYDGFGQAIGMRLDELGAMWIRVDHADVQSQRSA